MAKTIEELISQNIRRFRKQRGWTREQLAELCDRSAGGIAQLESGTRWPSRSTIKKIAQALEIEEIMLVSPLDEDRRLSPFEALATLCQDYGFDPPKPRKPKKKSA